MCALSVNQPVLSVAIIARDAESTIAATIECVAKIADEVVVTDTGSTDRTRDVARGCGAAVEFIEWQDDFASVRNHTMRRTRGRWILWLDAGETIDQDTAAEIRTFAEQNTTANKACMLLVATDPPTPHVSSEQIGQIRLLPNRPELVYQGRIRESVKPSLAACRMTVEGMPWRILCCPNRHETDVKQRRAERNLQLVELEANLSGPRPELHVVAGECYADLGEAKLAAEQFRRAIQYAERGSTTQLEAYYGLLTIVDAATDAAEETEKKAGAIHACVEAMEIFPIDAQLLCALGSYLQAEGRLDLATRSYQTAVRHGELNPETWHLADLRQISVMCLAVSLQLQDKPQQAYDALEAALQENARYDRVREMLIDQYVKACHEKEALALVRDMADPGFPRKYIRDMIRGSVAAINKDWNRALELLQPAFMSGCRETLCLRYLTVVLLASGNPQAAEPVLAAWREAQPSSDELPHYEAAVAEFLQAETQLNALEPGDRQIRIDSAQNTLRGISAPINSPANYQPPAHS
jgi:tetratricopeptide (TPR) repeat protein